MAGPKLLLIDDRPEICEVLHTHLTEQGFDVDYATDPIAAKRRVETCVYDLIIADATMPGEHHPNILRELENINSRILLMSGDPTVIAHKNQTLPYPFLRKPFHLDELDAAVRNATGGGHACEELAMALVTIRVQAVNFVERMNVMRIWLDDRRIQPSRFRYSDDGDDVLIEVGFKVAAEAAAFSTRFSGEDA